MQQVCPRVVIAGTGGDAGKTLLSLGLIASWRRMGLTIAPFKKGPDYIDAAWLGRIAGGEGRNLDTYLMGPDRVRDSFSRNCRAADIALVEGNRGVFDGLDADGRHSTAELAKLIDAPVVLVIGVTKVTRTAAAWILGCRQLDPELRLGGVILNRVGGARHEQVVRRSVERICGLPVLGAIPRMSAGELLPDRHLGLVTPSEHHEIGRMERVLAAVVAEHVDVEALLSMARNAGDGAARLNEEGTGQPQRRSRGGPKAVIGYFSDSAFTFYYPENLEALQREGAELKPLSSLEDRPLPELDALYIGGGFPETHAARLAENRTLAESVVRAVEEGLPVYAECGGLIYLARSLDWKGKSYPMAGVLPVRARMHERPMGHGYCRVQVDGDNPFFPAGIELRGHEFHYSDIVPTEGEVATAFRVRRGAGSLDGRDGLTYRNVLASYLHLHALGEPGWAVGLVERAMTYRAARRSSAG